MRNGEPIIQAKELAEEVVLTNEAGKRASADPLPGPLTKAFCEGPIEVAGVTVFPVVPRYFQALRALNSPLISMLQDVVQSGKIDTELADEQAWEICWIFTHTGKQVREAMSKGIDQIRELSMAEVGESQFPVALVTAAVMEQVKRHMETAVKYTAQAKEEGSISFFQDSAMHPNVETGGS